MSVRLWAPDQPADLYHERGEVNDRRPLFQGDVVAGITGPGLTDDPAGGDLVMLVSHPCSMVAAGAQYVDRVEVVRVRKYREVKFGDWSRTAFDVLPLPDLVEASGEHYAAVFTERAHVDMPQDRLNQRIACLSLSGVLALQQRLLHWTSRVAISTELLEAATKPVWIENEMQERWNEKFVAVGTTGSVLVTALAEEARAFDDELRKERPLKDEDSDYTLKLVLQRELRDPDAQARVRVAMGVVQKRRGKPTAGR